MQGKQILLLLGGNRHDFDGFAKTLVPVLHQSGHQLEASYDPERLHDLDQHAIDVVMMYTCLGGSQQGDHVTEDLSLAQTKALVNWVQAGGGLLALHAATVVGETNSELRRLLGGVFISHPPQFSFSVYPMFKTHPIIENIEAFAVYDEFYIERYDDTVAVHMVAFDRGVAHPMVWSKREGEGRVAHIALGHSARVWSLPPYQQLIRQAVEWVA